MQKRFDIGLIGESLYGGEPSPPRTAEYWTCRVSGRANSPRTAPVQSVIPGISPVSICASGLAAIVCVLRFCSFAFAFFRAVLVATGVYIASQNRNHRPPPWSDS